MLIFIDVDENGEITESIRGENIIPDKGYDFFFYETEEVAENIRNYKVVVDGFKSGLVKR